MKKLSEKQKNTIVLLVIIGLIATALIVFRLSTGG